MSSIRPSQEYTIEQDFGFSRFLDISVFCLQFVVESQGKRFIKTMYSLVESSSSVGNYITT